MMIGCQVITYHINLMAVQDAVNATVVAVVLPIRNPGKFVGHISHVSRVSHVDITAVGKFRRLYTKIITNTRTFQFSINEFIKNLKWKIEMV